MSLSKIRSLVSANLIFQPQYQSFFCFSVIFAAPITFFAILERQDILQKKLPYLSSVMIWYVGRSGKIAKAQENQ